MRARQIVFIGLILENWARIVESGREIKYVNMAHSDTDLSVETFKEQYRYFKTLWEGLKEMRRQGATLEEAKKKYSIEKDFPHFKDRTLEIQGTNIHSCNVEAIWERLSSGRIGPSGARCVSSIIAPLDLTSRLRNPLGPSIASSRVCRSSLERYSNSENVARERVVVPDCLGPVR